MDKIVAAIDFSPSSDEVVNHAEALARLSSGTVLLVHAAAPDPEFVGYEIGPEYIRDARAERLHEEHRDLQALAEGLRNRGVDAQAVLVSGLTVESILTVAKDRGADLIVVGSHGHGAISRALLGSVSTAIVHRSEIPVLVVPVAARDRGD